MKSVFFCFLALLSIQVTAQQTGRWEVSPYDFQNEDAGFETFYLKRISQVETIGNKLVLRNSADPRILILNTENGEKQVIGSAGTGPGEFNHGVAAMAVDGDQLWAISTGQLDQLMYFRNGQYVSSNRIPSNRILQRGFANSLAWSGDSLVIPASPANEKLAMICRKDGTAEEFGELVFSGEKDLEILKRNPYINHTLWIYARDHWYAVFTFLPQILVYDKNLKLVDSFSLEHPSIAAAYGNILEPDPSKPSRKPGPLIEDIKFFQGNLYVLCRGSLFKLDAQSGKIDSIHRFYAKGENVGDPNSETRELNFQQFAFTEDGTIFLSHVTALDLWSHDLFMIKNPSFLN